MAKKKLGDEELPPEVQAEVDKIRANGEQGGDEGEEREPEPERVAVPRPSRRQQEQQEREAALTEAREAAKRATDMVEEMRRGREEDRATLARVQGLIEGQVQQRRTEVGDRQQSGGTEPEPELPGWYRKDIKVAEGLLAEGKVSDYHEKIGQANLRLTDERNKYHRERQPAPPAAPPQKPAWLWAIESKYPDVVMHKHGIKTVIHYADLDDAQNGPEKVERAYLRARKELGTKQEEQAPPPDNGRQRQLLSGGPVNGGGPGRGAGAGGKTNAERHVRVPKNYREIARRAGMSPEDYIKSYAAMNPGEIE